MLGMLGMLRGGIWRSVWLGISGMLVVLGMLGILGMLGFVIFVIV